MRFIPMDVSTSSYVYGGGGPYDYDEPGLPDRFSNVVHAAGQSLWNGCNQSQLGVVAKLVDIKDDVDLEYCKFCGDGRYKPGRGRDHTRRSPRMQSLVHRRVAAVVACGCERPTRLWNGVWWSTVGVMGCPICIDDTRKFHLQHVMHIEKNVFNNIFNTVMDIKGKTTDNMNVRRDLKIIHNCPELELDERRPNVMPKEVYTLGKVQKRKVCEWIQGLNFPNGYASNLGHCVDTTELWMHGMKSHDCHVFMHKLIPIAFREMLPEHVWAALTEKVKNKAHVEASIVEAYVIEKIDLFTSQYFELDVQSKWSMAQRNDECTSSNDGFQVSIPTILAELVVPRRKDSSVDQNGTSSRRTF
ncbi:hypothetical protein Sango_2312600 [Sesamum angolense]|uniref:DUF4218 domain-containing protein n=1 Tax=Sesamum angolense TaxID=2727404 RepID=A0AAE1WAJ4_9LAMI|nr:hypothetical protein Sango_2312600 [Sesamum angolense]